MMLYDVIQTVTKSSFGFPAIKKNTGQAASFSSKVSGG